MNSTRAACQSTSIKRGFCSNRYKVGNVQLLDGDIARLCIERGTGDPFGNMNIIRAIKSLVPAVFSIGFMAVASTVMAADPVFDKISVETLPAKPGKHWVWVNDPNFFAASEGKAWLIDADAGKVLGTVQSGYPARGKSILRMCRKTRLPSKTDGRSPAMLNVPTTGCRVAVS